MKRYAQQLALTLVAVLLAVGCSRPAPGTETGAPPPGSTIETPGSGGQSEAPASDTGSTSPAETGSKGGNPSPPPVQGTPAAKLFPAEDMEFTFQIYEKGNSYTVTEHLLRDGDRVVGVQGEKVYLTWHLLETGVWRKDPKNPAVMLRYLPPTLAESAWAQMSGDQQVLFRLQPAPEQEHCPKQHEESNLACWRLTVVNRGEELTLTFLEGVGPVQAQNASWVRSADSFSKGRNEMVRGTPPTFALGARRDRWRVEGDKAPGTMPEVKPLEVAEFTRLAGKHHWDVQPGGPDAPFAEYDVDGDRRKELVRGTLGEWTDGPVSIYRDDYTPMLRLDPWPGKHRVTPVTFSAYPATYFLHEFEQDYGNGEKETHVTIYGYYQAENRPGQMVAGWGWDHKTSSTQATRVSVDPQGQVTVVWEMGDPAQHTRTRVYKFTGFKDYAGFGIGAVELVSSTISPSRGELVYPAEPVGVLTAAFNAYWLEQANELPRYFASPAAAERFTQIQQMGRPQYGLGMVKTGKLAPDSKAWSGMSITPAPVGSDGTVEFYASAGGYEWGAAQWGKAKLVKNSEGSWVVETVDIGGSYFSGP